MKTCEICGLLKGNGDNECKSVGFFFVGPATTEIEIARSAANNNEQTAKCFQRARENLLKENSRLNKEILLLEDRAKQLLTFQEVGSKNWEQRIDSEIERLNKLLKIPYWRNGRLHINGEIIAQLYPGSNPGTYAYRIVYWKSDSGDHFKTKEAAMNAVEKSIFLKDVVHISNEK